MKITRVKITRWRSPGGDHQVEIIRWRSDLLLYLNCIFVSVSCVPSGLLCCIAVLYCCVVLLCCIAVFVVNMFFFGVYSISVSIGCV